MRKSRWAMIISVLIVLFSIIGCGSKTTTSSETKSPSQETTQTQSSTSTSATTNDTTQTQSNESTSKTTNETTQTQSNANTSSQSAPTNNAQVQSNANTPSTKQETVQPQTNASTPTPTEKKNPLVTITMANGDSIKLELYPEVAPNTVKSFISLVQKGFYNGLTFHRVIPGFMIQGGDPKGNGTGGPGYSIKGEFTKNGFKNDLKHERGVLSMGRTSDPNSAGSQFFIMVATVPSLDNNYASFGKVISGMEAVDKVVNSPRDTADKPLEAQVMKTVTVDTFGVNYGEPDVIKK